MGQLYKEKGAGSGPKMTEDEVTAAVKDYGGGAYKPKPTAQPGGTTVRNTVSGAEFNKIRKGK